MQNAENVFVEIQCESAFRFLEAKNLVKMPDEKKIETTVSCQNTSKPY